jgi:hypothetical protein
MSSRTKEAIEARCLVAGAAEVVEEPRAVSGGSGLCEIESPLLKRKVSAMDDAKIKDTMNRHLPKIAAAARLRPELLRGRGGRRFTEEEVDAMPDKFIRDLIWKSSRRPE